MTYDAFLFDITKPSFIWFGSRSVDICTDLVNSKRSSNLSGVYKKFGNYSIRNKFWKLATKQKIYFAKKFFDKSLFMHEKHHF